MNAPANIKAGPAWAKYLPVIDAFNPSAPEAERRQRAGLMLLRDMASAGQRHSTWEATQALQAIERIAGQHALTEMPVDALERTRLALVRLYTGARALDANFTTLFNDGR